MPPSARRARCLPWRVDVHMLLLRGGSPVGRAGPTGLGSGYGSGCLPRLTMKTEPRLGSPFWSQVTTEEMCVLRL